MFDFLIGLGFAGICALICFIFLIPFIITVIVGTAFANLLGFTGIVWWAFVILFYLVISAILGRITK